MSASFYSKDERQRRSDAFPRSQRLTKTDDFSSVFSFRRTIRSRNFLLHYRPQSGDSSSGARLGIVVAKRLLRRSVDRNLVKRLIREVFRKCRSDLPACDLIVRLSVRPSLPIERRLVTKEVQSLLERLQTMMEHRP